MADAAESPGGQRAWARAGPRTLPEGRVPDAPALWGDVGVRASLPVTCRREQPGTQQAGPDPAACPSGFPASVPRGAALASRPVLDAGQTGLTAVSLGSQEQLRDPLLNVDVQEEAGAWGGPLPAGLSLPAARAPPCPPSGTGTGTGAPPRHRARESRRSCTRTRSGHIPGRRRGRRAPELCGLGRAEDGALRAPAGRPPASGVSVVGLGPWNRSPKPL